MVRAICLVLAIVALSPIASGTFLSAVVPALSPFVAMTAMLATRTFHALAWLGLIVGAAALLRRRVFCRWVCPAGLCLDGASWLGRRWGHRTARFPLLGRWVVGLTLGAAFLGYPFLLWLDPLARFAGLSALGECGSGVGLSLSVGGFGALLVLDLLWPHIWCARLCPLGAFQDLLSALAESLRRVAAASASLPMVVSRAECPRHNRPSAEPSVLPLVPIETHASGGCSGSILRRRGTVEPPGQATSAPPAGGVG